MLQLGPKGLDHSGVFTSDFLRSPFAMLIYTLVTRTPLLSATLRKRVGKGNSLLRQEHGLTIQSHNGQKINFSELQTDEWREGNPTTTSGPDCIHDKIKSAQFHLCIGSYNS